MEQHHQDLLRMFLLNPNEVEYQRKIHWVTDDANVEVVQWRSKKIKAEDKVVSSASWLVEKLLRNLCNWNVNFLPEICVAHFSTCLNDHYGCLLIADQMFEIIYFRLKILFWRKIIQHVVRLADIFARGFCTKPQRCKQFGWRPKNRASKQVEWAKERETRKRERDGGSTAS